VDADEIDLDPLVQALLRVDLSHHAFDAVHLHGLMNHHAPEDLRDDVVSLDQMVCVAHRPMDGAHQIELDALLALNSARDVKGGMGAYLYLPSLLSPSLFSIIIFFTINSREIKKGRSLKRPFL
jgi:hypothetical protein